VEKMEIEIQKFEEEQKLKSQRVFKKMRFESEFDKTIKG